MIRDIFKRGKGFLLGLAAGILLISATAYDDYFEISKNLEIHAVLFRELNTYYVDEVNPGELMKTGIDAMLASLDPYTNYYPESEIEDARFEQTGTYGGIGASFRAIDGEIVIAETYENAPAQKAGIIPGDVITEVNGKSVLNKKSDEVIKLIKGAPKSELQIKVRREADGLIKSFKLLREEIKVKNVPYSGMLNSDIGYIKLSGFTNDAGKNVRDALIELKSNNNLKGLVFDMRGNPGGLLREAINVSNVFIDKGKLVSGTKGKVPEWNKTYKTLNTATDAEIPLVILIDKGSASASEIVAGTVQDYDRGVLIGNKSYGKGLVQTSRPLKYNAQLKVTTSKYYIPSGRCIQALDYAHKDQFGKAGRVPDSLQKEFKTAAGRKVYDGAGVMPDVEVKDMKFHQISKSLIRKNLIFAFANKFRQQNQTIEEPRKFKITDAVYTDFINFLSGKDYRYETDTEIKLQELKKVAEKEKYFAGIGDEYNVLNNKLKADKKNDLITYKEEIKLLLCAEIISRYYYQKGRIEWALTQDDDVKAALDILNDPQRYKSILSSSFQIPRHESLDSEGSENLLIEIDESGE